MDRVERITYKSNTFIIVDKGKKHDVFLKTNLQTLKLTWFDPKEPQTMLLRDIVAGIRSGDIQDVPELFVACNGKIIATGVGQWYKEITG